METVEGLLDSGASGKFIDQNYAKKIGAKQIDLERPIQVYNVDGTQNKRGTIRKYVELNLEIHERKQKCRLLVTGLGQQKIILGYTWLKKTNPLIDWKKGTLEWRKPISVEICAYLQNLLDKPTLKKIETKEQVTVFEEKD